MDKETKNKAIMIRVDEKLHEQLKVYSIAKKKSLQKIVEEFLKGLFK